MMIFYPYADAEDNHEKLVESVSFGMDLMTPARWISWWSIDIPVSSIWKNICGTLGANINNEFLPHFISNQFISSNGKTDKAVQALLVFLSPITVPKDYPSSS
mgnify:FL=1